MRRKEFLWILLAFLVGMLLFWRLGTIEALSYQEEIAEEIIRLHVIADSDKGCDQRLKLQVKEAVVTELRKKLSEAKNIEEARSIICENLEGIETISNTVIRENGFSYKAKASLGQAVFPIKRYGDLTFPAGEYEALRIQLGKAEGKNWWCVMFPTLCFVDEAKQEITEENKEKFKEILTEEEYESISKNSGNQVFFKLKFGEYLNKVIDYFPI